MLYCLTATLRYARRQLLREPFLPDIGDFTEEDGIRLAHVRHFAKIYAQSSQLVANWCSLSVLSRILYDIERAALISMALAITREKRIARELVLGMTQTLLHSLPYSDSFELLAVAMVQICLIGQALRLDMYAPMVQSLEVLEVEPYTQFFLATM